MTFLLVASRPTIISLFLFIFIFSDLVKAHRSLCKRIRELEHSIKEEESKMITNAGSSVVSPGVGLRVRSSGMTDGEWDVLAVKRAQRIQKVWSLNHSEICSSLITG